MEPRLAYKCAGQKGRTMVVDVVDDTVDELLRKVWSSHSIWGVVLGQEGWQD